MSEDLTDSEPEEEKDRMNYTGTVSEDENEDEDGTGCTGDEEIDVDEEEEDEDYEEVVLKPRPLNEVTSLTDKTSPWTSILSEPDLVSVESLEPQETHLSEDEEEKRQTVNLQTHDCSVEHKHARQEESDCSNGSAGEASDTERDGERTLQALDETQATEPDEASGDRASSPTAQHATDTHDASCPLDNQDTLHQPYP